MENLIFCLNATVPIFLIMVIGYILRQLKIVDDPFVTTLNSFNFKITLPLLLFKDISESDFYSVWDTQYVLFCFGITLLCIIVITIAGKFLFKEKELLGEFIQASYRSSAAVLGIAFIQNMYGNAGMAPLMIIGTVPLYNVAAVIILSFTVPDHTQDNSFNLKTIKKSLIGIITNPIILAIILGMIFSSLPITMPSILQKTLTSMANLATPLALIGLGAGFEGRKALSNMKATLVSSAIKLLIQPALFLPFATFLGFRDEKLVAILIMLGAPTTVSCYIMAKNMKHEGSLTSSIVVATTFLSSVTITLWLFILKSLNLI